MPVPAIESHATGTLSGGTALVLSPSGGAVASGKLMVAFVTFGGAPAITAPSGWTQAGSTVTDGFSACRSQCWYKVAGGSEPSSYTWTRSNSGDGAGGIAVVTGQHASAFLNAVGSASQTSGTAPTAPSVTTTADNCLLLHYCGGDSSSNATVKPTGDTSLWAFASATTATTCAAYTSQPTAGATPTGAFSFTSTNQATLFTLALAPVTSGPLAAGTISNSTHLYNSVTNTVGAASGGVGTITTQMQRSPTGAGTWSNVSNPDLSVSAATTYDYRAQYTDQAPTTVTSNTITVTTDAAPANPLTPATLTLLSAGPNAASGGGIRLGESAAPTFGTAPYTRTWRRRTAAGGTPGTGTVVGGNAATLTDTGGSTSTSYWYEQQVTDSAGTPATVYSAELGPVVIYTGGIVGGGRGGIVIQCG